jgi:hypothetical protein
MISGYFKCPFVCESILKEGWATLPPPTITRINWPKASSISDEVTGWRWGRGGGYSHIGKSNVSLQLMGDSLEMIEDDLSMMEDDLEIMKDYLEIMEDDLEVLEDKKKVIQSHCMNILILGDAYVSPI